MPTLDWIGKKAVINHDKQVPFHLLNEVPELSYGDKDSGNMLIQGDNLVALKSLLPYYAGKVKCIYIDPPYNTGKEGWIYNDNVNSPEIKEWLGNVVGKESEDLSRHDKWLCMMYPRLKLLREFLREDGVIFISIDDHAQENLKYICNEIFGIRNFITQFIWNTDGHTDNQFDIKINHEYVIMYAKQKEAVNLGFVVDPNTRTESNLLKGYAENSITKNGPANPPSEVVLPIGFPIEEENINLNESVIPDGLIKAMLESKMTSTHLKNEYGQIQFPLRLDPMIGRNYALEMPCKVFSGWANVKKLKKFINNHCKSFIDDDGLCIEFFLSKNGVIYYRKNRGDKARNIVSVLKNMGTTEKMKTEIESMGLKFAYPKPKELLKYLIRIGSDKDDIILDSFAGSGTTGQAILELNSEDNTNRQFILIEMMSYAKEITAQRLNKVINGYGEGKKYINGTSGGFRYYRLGNPLFDEFGNVFSEIKFADLAKHVFFSETGMPQPDSNDLTTPFIGEYNERGIFLLYNGILKDKNPKNGNVLTREVLAMLPKYDGEKVIYGTGCRLSDARLKAERITFKQIPYDLRG